MPALQVRDFPEELYMQLKEYAAANHRSMAQQTIIAVDQMINHLGYDAQVRGGAALSTSMQGSGRYGRVVHFETEGERRARVERKRAALDRIHANYKEHGRPSITSEEIVKMIRDSREERTNRILEAVDIHITEGSDAS